MRIRGANGQTANLFVVETYAGTDKFVVDSDGDVTVTGNFTLTGSLAYTGEMAITGDTAATITLKITGASRADADLLVVEQNDGTDVFKIDKDGKAYFPLSRADGSATVTATNTYVAVTHGLASTPALGDIQITPQGSLLGRTFWVSDVGATTFRINMSTSDTIDHIFSWSAVI